MRDACGQLPERFKFLALDQRCLRCFAALDLGLQRPIGSDQFAGSRHHLCFKIGVGRDQRSSGGGEVITHGDGLVDVRTLTNPLHDIAVSVVQGRGS